jgi:hypothetical protein
MRFFEGEFPIVKIGHHGIAVLSMHQFAFQAACVFRVWAQTQAQRVCCACQLNLPLAVQQV